MRIKYRLSIAKESNITDAIIYEHMQQLQRDLKYEAQHMAGIHPAFADGKLWITNTSTDEIFKALPCFKTRQTVIDGLNRLEQAGQIVVRVLSKSGIIQTDKTGVATYGFCKKGFYWCTITPVCYHVPKTSIEFDHLYIDAEEAIEYGIAKATLLEYFRQTASTEDGFKRMCAKELEAVLPLNEKSIRAHLRELVTMGQFKQHEKHPKLYADVSAITKAHKREALEQIAAKYREQGYGIIGSIQRAKQHLAEKERPKSTAAVPAIMSEDEKKQMLEERAKVFREQGHSAFASRSMAWQELNDVAA